MNTRNFERVKEAFCHGVVIAVLRATHTLNYSKDRQQAAVPGTSVLHITIGMMNEVRRQAMIAERFNQCLARYLFVILDL